MTTLPNVIGIAGNAGAGKDTAAQWFVKRGYAVRKFADPIKQMLNEQFGWTMDLWEDRAWKEAPMRACASGIEHKETSPRRLAQWLGTDVVRNNFGKDAWVDLFKQRWHDDGQPKIVVPDVRFQNEVDIIHKLGGRVFYIERPDYTGGGHSSEQAHTLQHVPTTVLNNGTIEDLYGSLEAWARL